VPVSSLSVCGESDNTLLSAVRVMGGVGKGRVGALGAKVGVGSRVSTFAVAASVGFEFTTISGSSPQAVMPPSSNKTRNGVITHHLVRYRLNCIHQKGAHWIQYKFHEPYHLKHVDPIPGSRLGSILVVIWECWQ